MPVEVLTEFRRASQRFHLAVNKGDASSLGQK
jgi:hypothetical protein